VEDNGHGCDPGNLPFLFRPLYSTKKEMGGMGLGLYMVRSILEAHGASIRAITKNTRGGTRHGMVFCLDFPQSRLDNPELKSAGPKKNLIP
jgi:signal transduction histidine kinase